MTAQLSPFCQFDTPFSYLQQFSTVIKNFEILFSAPKTFNRIKLSTGWDFFFFFYQFIKSKYTESRTF